MLRQRSVLTALVSLLVMLSAQVSAEIYRWVDANGNVHYGDKPSDPKAAAKAETVELQQSYTPAQPSSEEEVAIAQRKSAIDQKNAARRKAEAEEKEERLAERRKARTAQCARDKAKLRKIDDTKENKDSRIFYYLKNKDGKAMTVAQQKQAVIDLKAKIAKRC